MPKRLDIERILIIGAGPVVIGQACEFDYAGVQACKALREDGYHVILVNSNPATIMTDPDTADATYIEPIHWQTVKKIIAKEKPDALLPTMGGQTGLNCALDLVEHGVLEAFGVELIGASKTAIERAEDRARFGEAMEKIGLRTPSSILVDDLDQLDHAQRELGYPIVLRPSFTLGGSGGGIAYDYDALRTLCAHGLATSPAHTVLLEKSVLGWKEYEMEVVRDRKDNCIIVCSIENLDPMGVHTGDSITVAPAQTLTDKEYQLLRDASISVLREIGVDTGGSNVQFAVNPDDGELNVIEMNPRVSRSSALASKATGFPIAKVAAKLAIGYTLDELDNEITNGASPISFEPTLDYIVTKIPRFTFEKFPQADDKLTTQMKSVGEVMAIDRTFQSSLQKAIRSLETGMTGLNEQLAKDHPDPIETIKRELQSPRAYRLWYIADAFRQGMDTDTVFQLCRVDRWFLMQIKALVDEEAAVRKAGVAGLDAVRLRQLKRRGFSDARLAELVHIDEAELRSLRYRYNIRPVFKRIDSCAAEFAAKTAYMYSTYEEECEARPSQRKKIMILGSGPNRIGQGLEFDYCCVQAALGVREAGYEAIMVNCNPETVSTDYDISDRLYFEPLTLEDVFEIIHLERPDGIMIQYGGQTPLKLAHALKQAGAPIIGTTPDSIDLAEDRGRFQGLLNQLGLRQPLNRIAYNKKQAIENAKEIGYPLVVRPSYVLGGRAMETVYSEADLIHYMDEEAAVIGAAPILLDRFLENAIEVDVDAVCDGNDVYIGGIMQHIEQAGVHSGDSACSLPPATLAQDMLDAIAAQTSKIALALDVVGLMNAQLAIQDDTIYVLEVNPRASRTVPFVSKAIGLSLVKAAVNCMLGKTLQQQGIKKARRPSYYSVKESVFPFAKFTGVDLLLGPEMKSTGEVMGVGETFGAAFAKSQLAAGIQIPETGNVLISVKDNDKPAAVFIARAFCALGYSIFATAGTASAINNANIECVTINKVREGSPHIIDMLKQGAINLIVNTTEDKQAIKDSYSIRRAALQYQVFYVTTIAAANATIEGIKQKDEIEVYSLQSLHARN